MWQLGLQDDDSWLATRQKAPDTGASAAICFVANHTSTGELMSGEDHHALIAGFGVPYILDRRAWAKRNASYKEKREVYGLYAQ